MKRLYLEVNNLQMKKEIRVGIADAALISAPDTLITMGLGSCIGIALYDKEKKIAGLVHIMLPDSTQFREVKNPYKYADLGIKKIFKDMLDKGCNKNNIIAKIVGGASMFNFSDKKIVSDIGKRNSEASIDALKSLRIPIIAEAIGGNKGRTMILDSEDGVVTIRSIGSELKKI